VKPWPWLRSALDHGTRQQVTRLGLLFTLTCVLVSLAAFVSANNLLFLVVATMLSVLLVSGLVSRLGLAGLELDSALPEHSSAGLVVAATLAPAQVFTASARIYRIAWPGHVSNGQL